MNSLLAKIIAVILLILGEVLSVYAEMIAAKDPFVNYQYSFHIFVKNFLLFSFAGGFLILGYMLGVNAFKNIWIVTAVSVTSILIVEPLLAYTLYHQLPTKGAMVGMFLGTIGLITTIFE